MRSLPPIILAMLLSLPSLVTAHGGVVEEDDLCVINIGYLKAHFKIYVPQKTGHDEYCEDIPINGESVFIMEYQHDGLSEAEIDFRIIRNVTGKGNFARLGDVNALPDLEAVTIRHAPAAIVADVYTLLQTFEADGEYIGIVSARQPHTGKLYTAVFPFEVGYTGTGVWPWIIGVLLLLQFNYWFMTRRRKRNPSGLASAAVVSFILFAPALSASAEEDVLYSSDAGHFILTFTPDIDPLEINRIHSWLISVTDSDRTSVADLDIRINGGMPDHNHGLPTEPRVSDVKGEGLYRIDGLRFHMHGYWEIRITLFDGKHRDDITIGLNLK